MSPNPFGQVKVFYALMLGDYCLKEHKVAIYRDAWGVRKLMSHVLRNLRSDRIPRDSRFNELIVSIGFAI